MLAVHGQQLHAVLCHRPGDQMAAVTRLSLLARARSWPLSMAVRLAPRPAMPTTLFSTTSGPSSAASSRRPSGPVSKFGRTRPAGQGRVQLCGGVRVGHADIARMKLFDLLQDLFRMAVGRQAEHLIPLCPDHIQALGADGAGGVPAA